MKKTIKMLTATVVAIMITSICVWAADYSSPPGYPLPPPAITITGDDINVEWDAPEPTGAKDDAGESLHHRRESDDSSDSAQSGGSDGNTPPSGGDSGGGETPWSSQPASGSDSTDIIDAIASGMPINVTGQGSVLLTSEALSEIAKQDNPVVFIASGYTVMIEPGDITNNAKAIDINMDITVATQRNVGGKTIPAVIIKPSAQGDFGFAMTITIPASQFAAAGLDLNNLKAYHIGDNGSITRHNVTVNADGSVSIKISGASEYLLTDEELTETSGQTGGEGFGIDGGLSGTSGNPQTGVFENPYVALMIATPLLAVAIFLVLGIKKKTRMNA